MRVCAREALERGRLDRAATSQLGVLTEDEYQRGLARIRADVAAAAARGESLTLGTDLRLYATVAYCDPAARL
jgi:uncharacterized SAM-dependent methyltransferase